MNRESAFIDVLREGGWETLLEPRWYKNKNEAAKAAKQMVEESESLVFRIRDYWGGVIFTNEKEA